MAYVSVEIWSTEIDADRSVEQHKLNKKKADKYAVNNCTVYDCTSGVPNLKGGPYIGSNFVVIVIG